MRAVTWQGPRDVQVSDVPDPMIQEETDIVRRGGTISVVGVYGGAVDPMPMMQLFDKGVTLRMGQANVRRWTDDIMGLLTGDDDPLDVEGLATHVVPLDDAPQMYATFQEKRDGAVKVLFEP